MHVTAFSPLGQGASYWRENVGVMFEESVKEIAKKHGNDCATVRLGLSRNLVRILEIPYDYTKRTFISDLLHSPRGEGVSHFVTEYNRREERVSVNVTSH